MTITISTVIPLELIKDDHSQSYIRLAEASPCRFPSKSPLTDELCTHNHLFSSSGSTIQFELFFVTDEMNELSPIIVNMEVLKHWENISEIRTNPQVED